VEKLPPGTPSSQARVCRLGTFNAQYAGVEPGETATFVNEFVIPHECLAGGDSGTFNLWVAMDPQIVGFDEQVPERQEDLNTQFFTAQMIDTEGEHRNQSCIDDSGKPGCVIDINVTKNGGNMVRMDKAEVPSFVGVLASDCALDMARPTLMVAGSLTMFGPQAYSGNKEGEMPADAVDPSASKPMLDVTYEICPRGDAGDGCAPGTSYTPLKIGGQPDAPSGLDDVARIDNIVAGFPESFEHPLFAAPDSEACRRLTGAPNASENWEVYGAYNLRVCANPSFPETGPGDKETDDNCSVLPIMITVTDPVEPGAAQEYALRKSFEQRLGNDNIGLDMKFSTNNTVDLSGAITQTSANAKITGLFSYPVLNAWANGAAYVSLVGSGVDVGLEFGGERLFAEKVTLPEINWSKDLPYSKEKCLTYNYGVAGIGLNLVGCVKGQVGIKASVNVSAKQGAGLQPPFQTATRIGVAKANVTPYAKLDLSLSANVNLLVARAGATGQLNLLDVQLPADGTLMWGLTGTINQPKLVATADAALALKLGTLSGTVSVWVDTTLPAWCEGGWFGYPCLNWDRVANATLASWSGWTWDTTLMKQSLGTLSLP
jgi:hypothetical protein